MGKRIRIEISENLREQLDRFRENIAEKVKKVFNLDEITINGTFTSEVLASKLCNESANFKIRKTGLNTGSIEFN